MKINNMTVGVRDSKTTAELNYKLLEYSNGSYYTIDRGPATDTYKLKIALREKRSVIDTIVNNVLDNKDNIIIEDYRFIFSPNIATDNILNCSVLSIGKINNKQQSADVEIELLVDNSILFTNDYGVPSGMQNLKDNYYSNIEINMTSTQSYNSDIITHDSQRHTAIFNGKYVLTNKDAASILNFHRVKRGNVVNVTEAEFGVTNMFGPLFQNTSHNVIIIDVKDEYYSNTHRTTTVELVRQEEVSIDAEL